MVSDQTKEYCFDGLSQDPKVYVQTTLDVHKKYNALVMSAFNNDAGFVAALDKVSGTLYSSLLSFLSTFCNQIICLLVPFTTSPIRESFVLFWNDTVLTAG